MSEPTSEHKKDVALIWARSVLSGLDYSTHPGAREAVNIIDKAQGHIEHAYDDRGNLIDWDAIWDRPV